MSSASITRRALLSGGTVLASAVAGNLLVSKLAGAKEMVRTAIEPREIEFALAAGGVTRNVYSYADRGPAPVLRVKQGEPLGVRLRNGLAEPTTIHWHGIRLPNAMDGVPFLTQPLVQPNETFDYTFSPPDAGSYWYHPHCNSLVQMSHGLAGLLIVEEAKDPGFDADIALNLRDWRLGDDGQFIALYAPRQTARAGTYGTVRTTNWRREPDYDAPSGSLTRLRVVVTDVTRVYKLAIEGAPGLIIALDGNPLPKPMPLDNLAVGPGQRADIIVRMPDTEGAFVTVRDFSSPTPLTVARLRAVGASRKRGLGDVKPLPLNPMAEPDLATAATIPLVFSATAEQIPKSQYCGDLGYSFWAINSTPWPGSSPDAQAPLAELKLGRSYILELHNRTPHPHPIHLHGMSFKLLRSDKRDLAPVWTDTAMVYPDERVDVALVADNLGDWLLHCHVIEHQETGMSGYLRVT